MLEDRVSSEDEKPTSLGSSSRSDETRDVDKRPRRRTRRSAILPPQKSHISDTKTDAMLEDSVSSEDEKPTSRDRSLRASDAHHGLHAAHYASSHRLGRAVHRHCLQQEALAPDVQHCIEEMFKTDHDDRAWHERWARYIDRFTHSKGLLCSYDTCELERLSGQRAIAELDDKHGNRLVVVDQRRCSDAKLAHLKPSVKCHRGLARASAEFTVFGLLEAVRHGKRGLTGITALANRVMPWGFAGTNLLSVMDAQSGMPKITKLLSSLFERNIFGDATAVFGMTIVPALAAVFTMLPVWKMPNCKRGHYSADGWVMFFSSLLTGLIYYWASFMVTNTTLFASAFENKLGGDWDWASYVNRVREWGFIPAGLANAVAEHVSLALESASGATASMTSLFDLYIGYLFEKLPDIMRALLEGVGASVRYLADSGNLPMWMKDMWSMHITDFYATMSLSAWTSVIHRITTAWKHWKMLETKRSAEIASVGAAYAQPFWKGVVGGTTHEENMNRADSAQWALAGIGLSNLSLYMVRFKDWLMCKLALMLTMWWKERKLEALLKDKVPVIGIKASRTKS
jgi:hypothetical protein